jgi:rubrerythrin
MTERRVAMGTCELLAHALAIEREAAVRYEELGQHLRDLGNDAVANMFLYLAVHEREHEQKLACRASGLEIPDLDPGAYAWVDEGAPETAAHNLVLALLTPHAALQLALAAEKRAQAFFETACECALDAQVAELAGELAAEEAEHVQRVEQLLRSTPSPVIDWRAVYG